MFVAECMDQHWRNGPPASDMLGIADNMGVWDIVKCPLWGYSHGQQCSIGFW